MSSHTHTSLEPGCYRCDLNRDEMATAMAALAEELQLLREAVDNARIMACRHDIRVGGMYHASALDVDPHEPCPDCPTLHQVALLARAYTKGQL